jgi:Zn-dependent protease
VFRLFGFDVTVRSGFVFFSVLIIALNPNAFGVWLAASIAGFTLLHELGHAVAARSAGANASISLSFMAGYTSFTATRPLSRARHALISVAGPATQIVVSVAVLLAMGVDPTSIDSVRDSGDPGQAIWWAGPMIGLLNLVPVLPLDGGHLAQTGLESILRRPALREMAIASVVVTIGVAVVMAATGNTGFVFFIGLLLLGQFQILQATSRKPRPATTNGAWVNDGFMQAGPPSPWQEAYRALHAGQPHRAEQVLLDDLTRDATDSSDVVRWRPPYDAPLDALQLVIETLPMNLPDGNAYSARVLAEVLIATGHPREGGEYAARSFDRHRTPLLAVLVARAAARMGDTANALSWVAAASDVAAGRSDEERALVARVLDVAPELQALRADPAYQATRAGLR